MFVWVKSLSVVIDGMKEPHMKGAWNVKGKIINSCAREGEVWDKE